MIPTVQLGQFGRSFANSDMYANFVASLTHAEGADASTTLLDEITANTWTAVGDAQLDTAQFRSGSSSMLLDGTGDEFTTPDATRHDPIGDLTVELSVRATSWVAGGSYLAAKWDGGLAGKDAWILYYNTTDTTLHLDCRDSDDTTFKNIGVTISALSTATWYDLAVSRVGDTFYFFVDGTLAGSTTPATFTINPDGTSLLRLGCAGYAANRHNGHIDNFRYTNGKGRYTANYTVVLPFVYP